MTDINSRQSILIVDDSVENLDILKAILEPEYDIKATTSPKKTIDIALSQNPPDLILLDVMMPGMDGFEVCRILKSNPVSKKNSGTVCYHAWRGGG